MLDTNAVIDWLVFDDAAMRPIVGALDEGRWRLASDAACVEELERALGYPEFGLDAAGIAARLGRYRALARIWSDEPAAEGLPACRDPDDQKFLDLATRCGARLLVTRDKALLRLAARLAPRFRILTPAAFAASNWVTAG